MKKFGIISSLSLLLAALFSLGASIVTETKAGSKTIETIISLFGQNPWIFFVSLFVSIVGLVLFSVEQHGAVAGSNCSIASIILIVQSCVFIHSVKDLGGASGAIVCAVITIVLSALAAVLGCIALFTAESSESVSYRVIRKTTQPSRPTSSYASRPSFYSVNRPSTSQSKPSQTPVESTFKEGQRVYIPSQGKNGTVVGVNPSNGLLIVRLYEGGEVELGPSALRHAF